MATCKFKLQIKCIFLSKDDIQPTCTPSLLMFTKLPVHTHAQADGQVQRIPSSLEGRGHNKAIAHCVYI